MTEWLVFMQVLEGSTTTAFIMIRRRFSGANAACRRQAVIRIRIMIIITLSKNNNSNNNNNDKRQRIQAFSLESPVT